MKTWNLGNTTVRNPQRIKDALLILKQQFEGQKFTEEVQERYFDALVLAGVIEGDPRKEGGKEQSGRKWGAAFNQLGLARCWKAKPPIEITAVGNALLSSSTLDTDIFLRQMLKIQLPSPTEGDLDNAAIHPFYLVLNVAVLLEAEGMKGITKEELALFVQSAHRDDQSEKVVESIREYRHERDQIEGRMQKRRFFLAQLALKAEELYGESSPQKLRTLQDYSDTTVRYSTITGIFTAGQQSLVIKEDQLNLAKAIVKTGAPSILDDKNFWEKFHDPSLPALPTDDTTFLKNDIKALSERLDRLSEETGSNRKELTGPGDNILQLKRHREDLEQELITQKEIQFYHTQGEVDQVKDILSLFESIKAREIIGGSDYLPAWAEWGVWRVFLSINTITRPICLTRGFKINSELFPIHHAKGGAADLCFEYDDNTIIPAEITLNTGERQYAAEREPVRTHVLKLAEQNPSADIIGIFVAPTIQPRTAHDFLTAHTGGDYSAQLDRVVRLNILPLTIDQLCQLLPGQKHGCRNYSELRTTLDELLALRPISSDSNGSQWLTSIGQFFDHE